MDKKRLLQLCDQISSAAESIVSVGITATAANAPQLLGIRQAVVQIATEINKMEEVKRDG